ncbi:MAG: hypothetical protein AAFP02_08310 [Bacteroidota bacterium]
MKQYTIFLLLAIFAIPSVWSQDYDIPPAREKQFESLRIAFLTRRLSLSSDEAKLFWPVYDAYREDLKTIYRKRKRIENRIQSEFEDLSDSELEKLSDRYIALQKEEYEIRDQYHNAFKEVLSPRKVILLYKAESDLNREMLKRLRENRQERN